MDSVDRIMERWSKFDIEELCLLQICFGLVYGDTVSRNLIYKAAKRYYQEVSRVIEEREEEYGNEKH